MFRPYGIKGAPLGKGGKSYEEEDRSRDWYCARCRERNFVKRAECFKCKAPKPRDSDCSAPPRPQIPQSGTTLNGMVKSYNRKGFGFLMCFGIEHCQDIHYTRENLSPKLQTRDIPGQHVTFEIHRSIDGKLTALNIRPIGEEPDNTPIPMKGKAYGKGSSGPPPGPRSGREEEDRSRDWLCTSCGERNFVKRFECFKCKATRVSGFTDAPPSGEPVAEPRRTVSPHAGSRAWREMYAGGPGGGGAGGGGGGGGSDSSPSRGRDRRRHKRRKRSRSSSNSSSSSSRAKKKKKRRRSRSGSSSSSNSKSSDCKVEENSGAGAGTGAAAAAVEALKTPKATEDPELQSAKTQALEELLKLRQVPTKEARMTEFRALLRKWHPDKNPERVEVATAVFQFLQKGKPILEAAA